MIGSKALAAGVTALAMLAATGAEALDKVRFGTNWVAQAEHGGYYQALVDGTYAKYGLDVEIVPGGPQSNNRMLLPVGKLDFYMGGNMIQAFSAVQENIPTIVVAAHFQKDPQVIISHPGLDKWEDLKKATLFISKEGLASFYQWMVSQYGFKESQVRPYNFNAAPFIADKNSGQQGYLTSEPLAVEREAGFKPNVFLLADYGFSTYATTVETRLDLVEKNPDLVQRFVDASAIGWYNYLYGDNTKANEAIKRDNPEMTDEQIAYSIAKIKEYGIVDSGDALEKGIGAMTDERMKDFFDKMVKAGVVPADLDYKKSYTLQFVNKGVGLDLRPRN
ncbi:ABC transporter substrate-binding protein [Chelatococcus composti]|jgi:NitT/TauT family transport system substrate-binding protein|uniref:NitT/TauT family transport system substrate-binding protein n=1 Tax=Chelatococcus composti TaxID=1743235 RepID=A0A841K8E4_9HYPH|nr:ABC transporter substrate-binding protein [Chelatococcus composti]MBB6167722.1 NitT/TauT family transport system substrate-binding protein [Chelatococcus composti]MBS7735077.1 ABC transporter substrate-binding protein [Chelatococcus composti]PZN45088.1 MAG: nitrate ABC transporter substrate-binding protein [Pseudomonadota bacterium]GGG36504.1 ABC transporter substrate-binding protein [Chelatococcus composti]